jgi:hypothetical protein
MLNVALADAAITAWDAKYAYDFWRPITAIQNADRDGNDQTTVSPDWQSYLITPPFPEYVSGHSMFSAAAAEILTNVFGDNTSFATTSFGLPGVTRSFTSFEQAAQEAGSSRIYGGIHFEFSNQDAQAAGRALAAHVLNVFAVSQDTLAPAILFQSPVQGLVTPTNITISGRVLDNVSGVASLQAQLDGSALANLNFDNQGNFSFTPVLALDGSADGQHVLALRATDAAGNTSPFVEYSFTVDTQAPILTVDLPLQGATIKSGARLTGSVSGTGSPLVSLTYTFDGGTPMPILATPGGGAFDVELKLMHLAAGSHTLSVKAIDAAGNESQETRLLSLVEAVPFGIAGHTPTNAASDVGSTFRPQVFFSRPVATATLNSNNFYATDTTGRKLPARIVPAGDGSFAWLFFETAMPGSSTITVHVDGSTILAADGGDLLDANGDGAPGGQFQYRFSTVSLAPLAGTTLSGKVVDPGPDLKPMTFDDIRAGADGALHTSDDVFLNPIAGVRVFIVGLEHLAVFTDSSGNFHFDAVPSGNVKLAIDGNTASNAPAGFYFPEMVMDLNLEVGQANTVMGTMGTREEQAANRDRPEVYLPRLQTSILQDVSSTGATTIGVDAVSAPNLTPEQRQQLTIEIQPGSLIGPDGQPLAAGQVGISTVPPELVRDMLPPGLLQHTFDITIQAPGISNFATPARMTFPNVFNAAPGTKLNFLSFDHTTGRLVIEGSVTVSPDGLTVVTDPGTGITKAGWHGVTGSGSPTNSPPPCFSTEEIIETVVDAATEAAKCAANFADIRSWIKLALDLGKQLRELTNKSVQIYEDLSSGNASCDTVTTAVSALGNIASAVLDAVDKVKSQNPAVKISKCIEGALTLIDNICGRIEDDSDWSNIFVRVTCVGVSTARGLLAKVNDLLDDANQALSHLGADLLKNTIAQINDLVDELCKEAQNAPAPLGASGSTPAASGDHQIDPEGVAQIQALLTRLSDSANAQLPDADVLHEYAQTLTEVEQQTYVVLEQNIQVEYVLLGARDSFYLFQFGTTELRGRTDGGANFSVMLPARTAFELWMYDPGRERLGKYEGQTSASGVPTIIPMMELDGSDEPVIKFLSTAGQTDADLDGLVDDAEKVIGSIADNADSDGDGIGDLAEIQQGLEIFGERLVATGVTGSVSLLGQAKEIIIEGSTLNNQEQVGYVATGSHGLAIVDAAQFRQPVVMAQHDLPGDATDVAVDARVGIAAVASNSGGVHLVDVSNPQNPFLVRTINVSAGQVEIVDGIVYAAVGQELRSFDLLTGEVLQKLNLGGDITGLAREGSFLYTMDSALRLRALDLSGGLMVARGSLVMPAGGGKLFVGGGIAYAAAETGFPGGFSTANVANPDNLTLLSGVDAINIAGKAIAVNGSGLAISVGNPAGLGNLVHVLDVSDPSNTAGFVTQFSLPADPVAIAIAGGIAFVADGVGGLQVVNYRSFDNLGQPPMVSVAATAADLDPNTPGVQVLEGTTIPINVTVSDDVQVRNVELLVNGQVVRNDVSFPFDLSAVVPNIPFDQVTGTVEIQVRAIDTGGNATLSEPITLDIVPDTFAPTVLATNVPDGGKRGQAFRTIVIDFSEAMDTETLTADNIQLIGPSGAVVPTSIQFRNGDRTVQFTYQQFEGGAQQLRINREAVTDRAGNALGTGQQTINFSIVAATAVWINPADGFWDVGSNWDTGMVPGQLDDVLLDVASGAKITYRSGNTTIRSLSSNNPFAITGGTLTVNETLQVNNTFTLSGGTFKDATVLPGTGGQGMTGTTSGGTLSGVTFNGDLTLSQDNAFVRVTNGLTLNGTAHLSGANTQIRTIGNQTIGGSGSISFEGTTGSERYLTMEGTGQLTLAAGFTVRGGRGRIGHQVEAGGANVLVNEGTILADVSGQTLNIQPSSTGSFSNSGVMEARNGGSLTVGGGTGWSSTGTITSQNNSTVNLGGSFSRSGLGTVNSGGGTVNLTGTLNNSGAELTLDAASGSWRLLGGTINGGTINFADGQTLVTTTTGGTLSGVTFNGDLTLSQDNAFVRVTNGLTLNGTAHLSGANTQIRSIGNQTIGGSGSISFEGTTGSERYLTIEGTGQLTLAAGFTVRGGRGRIGHQVEAGGANVLVNEGTILADASGQTLNIQPSSTGSFSNSGVMEARNGGSLTVGGGTGWSSTGTITSQNNSTVNLGGSFTRSGLGTVNSGGGTVNLTGTLNNSGAELTLDAASGSWRLLGGTINGGTINFADGQTLVTTTTGGTLSGVTFNGDLTLSQDNALVRVTNGLTLNGTAHLSGANTQIRSIGNQTIGGSGSISFEGTTGSERYLTIEGTGQLTLAAGFTVRGGRGRIGHQVEAGGANVLVNEGTILADASGQTLNIQPSSTGSFSNSGVMEARNGGSLTVGGGTGWSSTGTITSQNNSTVNLGGSFTRSGLGTVNSGGGTVNLTGTLNNSGAELTLDAASGSWRLLGGTINGGTINFADGQTLVTTTTGGTLSGVTFNGDLTLSQDNALVRVTNGLTLNGTAHLSGANTQIRSIGNQTIGGSGSISFEGTTGSERYLTIEGTGQLTLAAGFTVRGGRGRIGHQVEAGGANVLVNEGTILADVSGQTLNIQPSSTGSFSNSGVMEARNGGSLTVGGGSGWSSSGTITADAATVSFSTAWSNSGTISSQNNSTVNLGGSFTRSGLGTFNRSGGIVNLTGTLNNSGAELTLDAASGSWRLLGGTINGGTINFADGQTLVTTTTGGTLSGVTFNGDLTLSQTDAFVRVSNGLTLNGTAHLSGSNTQIRSIGNQTIGGSGSISFEGSTGSERYLTIEGTGQLTLAAGFTVRGGRGRIGHQLETGGANVLVNEGTILADVSGQTLNIQPSSTGSFSNSGVMEARNGGSLTVGGGSGWSSSGTITADAATVSFSTAWSNSGTITSQNNSTVNLGGSFSRSGLGTFNRSGGIVNLTGTLNNSGALLNLDAASGSWRLLGGTINGGTINFADGQTLVTTTTGGTLSGVTFNGDLTLSQTDAFVRVSNGLTLNGTAHLSGSNTQIRSIGNQTIGGSGSISFEGSTGSERYLTIEGTGQLTLAAGFTVRGGRGRIGHQLETGGANVLVNEGTILADVSGQTLNIQPSSIGSFSNSGVMEARNGGSLNVGGGSGWSSSGTITADAATVSFSTAWSNSGTISSQNNSTVNLGGSFTRSGLGTFNRSGGTVNLTGTLNNSGALLTLDAASGSWRLLGGTINGGTINFADGQTLVTTTTGGTLSGVTFNGDLTLSQTDAFVRVSNGLTLNGTAHLSGANTQIRSIGNQTIGGSGSISFEGSTGSERYLTIEGTGQLTLAAGFTVRGGRGRIGHQLETGGANVLVNEGTILADVSGQTLNIQPSSIGSFSNSGVMEARNGGSLNVGGGSGWSSSGTITADAATVSFSTAWSNSGTISSQNNSTVNLGGSFTRSGLGTFNRSGGTVNLTGTLNNSGALLTLDAASGSWRLLGGTINGGTINFADGQTLVTTTTGGTLSGVTFNGDLTLSQTDAFVRVSNGLTLNGTAHLSGANTQIRSIGNQTIGGSGSISFEGSTGSERYLTIEGTGQLTLAAGFTVRGGRGRIGHQLETGGANVLVNEGTILADVSGQTLNIQPSSTGSFSNSGVLEAGNGGSLNGSRLASQSGRIVAGAGGLVSITGNLIQETSASLDIEILGTTASQYGRLTVSGSVTLSGALNVAVGGGFVPVAGNTFVVLTFGSRSDDFSTVNGLGLPNDLVFNRTFSASNLTLTATEALRASAPAPNLPTDMLMDEKLQSTVTAAITLWESAGIAPDMLNRLRGVNFQIAHLGANHVGLSAGNTIWIDDDAAGWGWFIDETPLTDTEYSDADGDGILDAKPGSQTASRVDLLTVVMHEFGHILGADHGDAERDLLFESLGAGERKKLSILDLDSIFENWSALDHG